MSYSRFSTLLLLLGIILVSVFPINAQDTTHPPITTENVNQLTEINRLGRGRVTDVAWSPDGQMLAIGGGAGVWLYSSDYDVVSLLEGEIMAVYWLADSRRLLTVNFRVLTLWDVETQSIIMTTELDGSTPREVAISPDGTQLAIASGRAVRLVDLETLEVTNQLEGHSGSVNAVVWLSDLELLSADSHGNLMHWNAVEGTSINTQELGTGIETIRVSPTGTLLAFGFTTGEFRIVEAQTQNILISTDPTPDLLTEIAWSPDGTSLAVARNSGNVEIWDSAGGQMTAVIEVFTEEGRAFQFSIAWTSESDRLVVATEVEVALFDAATGFYIRPIDQFSIDSFDVTWSPDSAYLGATWAAPPPNDKIAVWDVDSGELLSLVDHASLGMWLADSQSFVYIDQATQPIQFKVWRMDEAAAPNLPDLSGYQRVFVSPDGTFFAALTGPEAIEIHDLNVDFTLTIQPEVPAFTVGWSPNSSYFLTIGAGTFVLWDTISGEIAQTIETAANMDFAFSPDESRLAISNGEDQFEVWDIDSGELLQTVQTPYQFRFLEWSPQGDLVLINHIDGMSFWSTETWEEVFNFEASGRARWSPDGTMIAASGSDGIIWIWGIPTP